MESYSSLQGQREYLKLMEDQNYFDKFVEDLARREEAARKKRESMQREEEEWKQRRKLDALYREKTSNRIRCAP